MTVSTLAWIILTFVMVVGLFVLLIFKSSSIVTLLHLDKNFESDHINLGQLKTDEIVKIALIIIGGFLIIDNIPIFLSHIFFRFKGSINDLQGNYDISTFYLIVSALKIGVGYILITNFSLITNLLKIKKNEKPE